MPGRPTGRSSTSRRGLRGRAPIAECRLLASYRLAILLSNGRVAKQWVRDRTGERSTRTKRDEERVKLRAELSAELASDPRLVEPRPCDSSKAIADASAAALLAGLGDSDCELDDITSAADRSLWVCRRLALCTRKKKVTVKEVNELLEIVALGRLEDLRTWMSDWPPRDAERRKVWWQRRPLLRTLFRRKEFPPCGIEASETLIRTRIAASAEADPKDECSELIDRWPIRPPGEKIWEEPLQRLKRFWDNRRDDAWQLHYNAACAVASLLLEGSILASAESQTDQPEILPKGMDKNDVVGRPCTSSRSTPTAPGAAGSPRKPTGWRSTTPILRASPIPPSSRCGPATISLVRCPTGDRSEAST